MRNQPLDGQTTAPTKKPLPFGKRLFCWFIFGAALRAFLAALGGGAIARTVKSNIYHRGELKSVFSQSLYPLWLDPRLGYRAASDAPTDRWEDQIGLSR
ncbi:hypothetical protein D4A39_01155 [Alcanivorax profundi]|uniref:Uncharacterized protein n=1 Tax=Alcanivorax profundi TaxID=2338368 RepID=A0A418Y1W3_9GAMM|nr:hypothetical protein D4A39_01155 [Alcanivorax profundi]